MSPKDALGYILRAVRGKPPAEEVATEWRPNGSHPRIAIVFIHGLHGHHKRTWGFDDTSPNWINWIRMFENESYVLSIGYNVAISTWLGGSMPIYDRAINLLEQIDSRLPKNVPIILIAHSYGGLLAKQIFRLCDDNQGRWGVGSSLRSIVFLGTPNAGSRVANIFNRFSFLYGGTSVLSELEYGNSGNLDLSRWFRLAFPKRSLRVEVFTEMYRTWGSSVVDDVSSDPGVPGVIPIKIDCNHSDLARPTYLNDIRVQKVGALIREFSEKNDATEREMMACIGNIRRIVEAHADIDESSFEAFKNMKLQHNSIFEKAISCLESYRSISPGYGQANQRRIESNRTGLLDFLDKLESTITGVEGSAQ